MQDVIIIGAGPAGSSCAKKIAEEGYDVIVYDRRTEIGSPKRCGEGLEKKAENLIGRIPSRCVAQKIKGARIYAPNGKYLEAVVEGGGYVLERKVFDKWLANEAVKIGVNLQANTYIKKIEKINGGIKVKGEFLGEKFEESARIVVTAVGAESPLPKQAGVDTTCRLNLVDTCLQYEMAGVKSDPEFIHIYLGNEIALRGYCLTPDTEIFAKNTVKPINDIKIGEEVLTKDGWVQVSGVSERDYSGKVIRITPFMLNNEVGLTADHLIMIWNKKDGFGWKRAEDVEKSKRGSHRDGDYLVFPIPKEDPIKHIDLTRYYKGIIKDGKIYPIGRNQFGTTFPYKHGLPIKLKLTEELMELFGYFVSEGNVNSNGIIISNTNLEIVDRIKVFGEKSFNFKASVWQQKENRDNVCFQVHFASKILKQLFSSLFGVGCRNKKLPSSFIGLNVNLKKAFIVGLFRGDGSKEKSTENYDILNYTTTSKTLVYDLWLLLASIGIIAAIGRNKKKNAWRLRIRGKQIEAIDMFGKSNTGNRGNRGFFIKDDKIILGIRDMKRVEYKGKVYDIESGGTFCPFFIVHNCWIFPKGNKTANVGVGVVPHEKTPKFYLNKFIKENKELNITSILEVNGGTVPVGGFLKNMVSDNFVVCGEAAHHVNPIHGGGIKEAIVSGQIAAGVIIDCLKRNDLSKKALSKFNERWWKERGKKLEKVEKAREIVEKMTDEHFNMLADLLKPEDVIELSKGNLMSIGKVLVKNPKLIRFMKLIK